MSDLVARNMASKAWSRTCRLAAVPVPALLLGASKDLPVSWADPMPGPYTVEAVPTAGLLGACTVTVKSQDAAGCVVSVSAVLAVSGGVLLVHARN
jgi:hypothetical protein